MKKIYGLTIRQPWAYCITHLDKRVENRTWPLPSMVRGKTIALHTSKRLDELAGRVSASQTAGIKLSRHVKEMKLGCVVATAKVTGCVTESESKWFVGPYGFVLESVRPLATPIPISGRLGFWELPQDVVRLITKEVQA